MGTAFIIIGLILTAVLSYVAYWDKPEKDKSGGVSKAQELSAMDKAGQDEYLYANEKTHALVMDTLMKMGGTIKGLDEKTGRIQYEYQGHIFLIDSSDDCLFITVWDPYWHEIPLEDIDQLATMRKVMNLANQHEVCTLFYTIDEEDGMARIHSKKNLIFVSKFIALDTYLQTIFSDFFQVERRFLTELERITKMEGIKV